MIGWDVSTWYTGADAGGHSAVGIPLTDGLFVPGLREGGIQPGNPTYSRTVGLVTSKLGTTVNPNSI